MTRHRSKFTLKFSEFSYKIKTRFVFVLIANYNCISLDRIIIKAWLDIMRFVVVIWANQFQGKQYYYYYTEEPLLTAPLGKGKGAEIVFFFSVYRTKSTNYRFSMFSKLLTRGFSFQFHFLLWNFNIAHFLFMLC